MAMPPRRWPTKALAAANSAWREPRPFGEGAHQDEQRDHRERVVREQEVRRGLEVGDEGAQPSRAARSRRCRPAAWRARPACAGRSGSAMPRTSRPRAGSSRSRPGPPHGPNRQHQGHGREPESEAVASAMPQPIGSASTMELVWLANASRRRPPSATRSAPRPRRRPAPRRRRAQPAARAGARAVKVSTMMLAPCSWQIGRKAKTATARPICTSSKSPGMAVEVSQRRSTLAVTKSASASTRPPPASASQVLARDGPLSGGPAHRGGQACSYLAMSARAASSSRAPSSPWPAACATQASTTGCVASASAPPRPR